MPPFPPITELLPHRGSAVLLERVVAHDDEATVCTVDPRASTLYRGDDGAVPTWVGLEYMAQAVAAHGGLLDRRAGRPPRPGFFLGSRRLAFAADRFDPDLRLEVTAKPVRASRRMMAFDCAVRREGEAEPVVSGVLTVYLLDSFEALVEDFSASG
jgi:predicted hotdog family 3-hydroxylacyl-ACP dehydratase